MSRVQFSIIIPEFGVRKPKGVDLEVPFWKYQALGNDFIVVKNFPAKLDFTKEQVIALCDRHFGIGADGVIVVRSVNSDFFMLYYNADGSSAAVCGNGLRCLGKFLYDQRLSSSQTIKIRTLEGVKKVTLLMEEDEVVGARVDMGEPRFKPAEIPMLIEGERVVNREIRVNEEKIRVTCLSLGNPHCVIFAGDESEVFFKAMGPALENLPLFPQKTNVEFAKVEDSSTLKVRVWERGVGMTLACGTGACAAFVAATLNGHISGRRGRVILPGGELLTEWGKDNRIRLTGPAEEVFSGTIALR